MLKRTFGSLLKRRRQVLSLTRQAFADRLGVSTTHVAALEAGLRKPSFRLLQRIADTLYLDPQKLFLLSHPTEARFLRESRKREKSVWQRFIGNKALLAMKRVTPAELRVLKEISRLGRVSSERQLRFVLKAIRLALDDDPKRW